jgi:hypothetical protein
LASARFFRGTSTCWGGRGPDPHRQLLLIRAREGHGTSAWTRTVWPGRSGGFSIWDQEKETGGGLTESLFTHGESRVRGDCLKTSNPQPPAAEATRRAAESTRVAARLKPCPDSKRWLSHGLGSQPLPRSSPAGLPRQVSPQPLGDRYVPRTEAKLIRTRI